MEDPSSSRIHIQPTVVSNLLTRKSALVAGNCTTATRSLCGGAVRPGQPNSAPVVDRLTTQLGRFLRCL